ncbi:MAG: hypothetical protein ACI9KN_001343, partial [Gammaproteobacteria bacterium]
QAGLTGIVSPDIANKLQFKLRDTHAHLSLESLF